MSLTSLLADSVSAIQARISSQSATASPSDLAYMAKALESIGGRVSLVEVDDFAQQSIANITTVANNLITALNNASAADVAALNNASAADNASLNATLAAAISALNNAVTAAQAQASQTASTLVQMGQTSPLTMFLAYAAAGR